MGIAQRHIWEKALKYLGDNHPHEVFWNDLLDALKEEDQHWTEYNIALLYLRDHGFIEAKIHISDIGDHVESAKLTRIGQDRLMPDGGLTAESQTITIKFHEQAISVLGQAYASHPDPETRERAAGILARIKDMPASTTETILIRLLEMAAVKTPDLLNMLHSLL